MSLIHGNKVYYRYIRERSSRHFRKTVRAAQDAVGDVTTFVMTSLIVLY